MHAKLVSFEVAPTLKANTRGRKLTHSKDANASSDGRSRQMSSCLLDGVEEYLHRSDALLGFHWRDGGSCSSGATTARPQEWRKTAISSIAGGGSSSSSSSSITCCDPTAVTVDGERRYRRCGQGGAFEAGKRDQEKMAEDRAAWARGHLVPLRFRYCWCHCCGHGIGRQRATGGTLLSLSTH